MWNYGGIVRTRQSDRKAGFVVFGTVDEMKVVAWDIDHEHWNGKLVSGWKRRRKTI